MIVSEGRVRRVIEPILTGDQNPEHLSPDDIGYIEDLELMKTRPDIHIANRIYKEFIPRELAYSTQITITHETSWYNDEKGKQDMEKLLAPFQDFYRKHAEIRVEKLDYRLMNSSDKKSCRQ